MTLMDALDSIHVINFFELSQYSFKNTCVTIGNFDGVHLGHQAVIQKIITAAHPQNKPVIVVTFFPNPLEYFNSHLSMEYLSTPKEKQAFLLDLGVDHVVTFKFDQNFADLSAGVFLKSIKENLGLSLLVVGRDFALGKNRAGTLPVIREIGRDLSFEVRMINPINFATKEISSTGIRKCLDEGDVTCAAKLLGRPYAVAGPVTHGADRGARIGLPTVNITHWPQKKLPAIGVYATRVFLDQHEYQGITNIGVRPTFEIQSVPNVETHILDFDRNIYGENLELHFIQKIRDEKKFNGATEFLARIERDKAAARKIFEDGTS